MKQEKSNYRVKLLIICNEGQKAFFENLIAFLEIDLDRKDNIFVCQNSEFDPIFSSSNLEVDLIIIEIALNWNGKLLQHFYGFNVASDLRRAYLIKCPIIFFSPLKKSYFEKPGSYDNKYGLLESDGIGYLSFPFTIETLNKRISEIEPLNDDTLNYLIIKHCGLQKEWQLISHKLASIINNQNQNEEIRMIVDEWAISINQFAPHQKDNLASFQNLLKMPPESVNASALKRALEKLADGLQNAQLTTTDISLPENSSQLPKCPPKGFSKVLIADDESQHFLASSLQNQYGYDVIRQAYKLSQAKDILNKEKPDVVLSDYYFKQSSRKTEVPNKSIGDRFIQYALTHPQYVGANPKKPIVLVTSKATLRTETEIRAGAINCSGANRATDPAFIHSMIWAEAKKRGVFEQEKVYEQEWTLAHTCRQKLEQYVADLPKLIRQWNELKETVRDTLRLCRILFQSTNAEDRKIVQRAINILEPYETEDNFSFEMVENIFVETDKVHKFAQTSPKSQAKRLIRNILHGKIEQFSSVTNAIRFLIVTHSEVAKDLISLPQFKYLGNRLEVTLSKFSESDPLLPFLTLLNEKLGEILSSLPQLPSTSILPQTERNNVDSNKINIIVVEDNAFWRDFILSAIAKTKSRLGKNFTVTYQCFDNAADALAAIPSTNKSFAIDGSNQDDVKTIAIVDICLPESQEHANKIRAVLKGESDKLATPHSTHGLNLIRNLCSYNYNIPLIIFSTIDSIEDRTTICSWGVPDEDFLAKGVDDENTIMHALIRKIEKKTKYVIKRFENEIGNCRFWINGIPISFPNELSKTFSAIYNLCQTTARNEFSIAEIVKCREDFFSEGSKKTIQDQISRIRKLILETLRNNHVYVNVRELIKTRKSSDGDGFTYQLNAEVMPLDEEEYYESDLEIFETESCKILVIENNPQTLAYIIEPLKSLGYEVDYATNVEDAIRKAVEFRPHIISLDLQIPRTKAESESIGAIGDEFAGLDTWRQIRVALTDKNIGIVVPTLNTDKNYLIAQAAQIEIPIRNFISKRGANWLSFFLKKVADEKRRLYLGEVADITQDINEPIIEILYGSDLSEGILRLIVNYEPFTMNISSVSKIIGLLLANPKTELSFETIKKNIGSEKPVTKNDQKNWTKRIRAVIREKWLKSTRKPGLKELAEKILESSSKGLKLNAQVFDSRTREDL